MLIYEPASTEVGPIAIARISDEGLLVSAAEVAVFQAQARAAEIGALDETLGRIEELEAQRLRALFALLVPGFRTHSNGRAGKRSVM